MSDSPSVTLAFQQLGEGDPLVIEFFDEPAKVDAILEHLNKKVEPGHIVSWPAQLILGE